MHEQSDAGALTAAIGFINGGRPRLFQFDRDARRENRARPAARRAAVTTVASIAAGQPDLV